MVKPPTLNSPQNNLFYKRNPLHFHAKKLIKLKIWTVSLISKTLFHYTNKLALTK